MIVRNDNYSFHVHYYTDAVAFSNSHFGSGSGAIHLDNVICAGTESTILDCTYLSGSSVTCFSGHNEDAGVKCQC